MELGAQDLMMLSTRNRRGNGGLSGWVARTMADPAWMVLTLACLLYVAGRLRVNEVEQSAKMPNRGCNMS